MISRFFIDRPIFATVLSVVITLIGGISLYYLPMAQYPRITPPGIAITINYPGASAPVVADTVAAPIEQQVNGIDGMLYMSSQMGNDGTYTLTVTFDIGTDVNAALVMVQNRVALAMPQLPSQVQNQGITIRKKTPDMLMIVNFYSDPIDRYDDIYLSNFATIYVKDELLRVYGVSDINYMGQRDYSIRAWLDPQKLAARNMTAMDVANAIRRENVDAPAGQLGQLPATPGQYFQLPLDTLGRLSNPEQFENIVVKTRPGNNREPAAGIVRLCDVARVELGATNYNQSCTFDGKPSVGLSIYQLPGTNALDVADRVRAKMKELETRFPDGVKYDIAYDTTPYIRESIREVFKTLRDAVFLVGLVVLVFLQDWKTMILPMIDVPVSLIGTFGAMAALGFSLNNLTLFGLVLAIGIVVDDAIVVLENTERMIAKGYDARTATIKAMEEITGPIIAITLALSAVFIPCCFIGGITGQFFRQFAVTIAVSTIISAVNALTMTPSRAVLIFKTEQGAHGHEFKREALPWWIFGVLLGLLTVRFGPHYFAGWQSLPALSTGGAPEAAGELSWAATAVYFAPGLAAGLAVGWFCIGPVNAVLGWLFRGFNRLFDEMTEVYGWMVGKSLRISVMIVLIYGGLLVLTYDVFRRAPLGFIPEQDQGRLILSVQLPDSASLQRTMAAMAEVVKITRETPGVAHTVAIAGMSFLLQANASNFGSMFIVLDPFDERQAPDLTAEGIMDHLGKEYRKRVKDAVVAVRNSSAIPGLGVAGGYKLIIEDRGGRGLDNLQWASDELVATMKREPGLATASCEFRSRTPQLYLDIDRTKAESLGLSFDDVNQALTMYLGSLYINSYNEFGRHWQVNIQLEGNFRNRVEDINLLQVRNKYGQMVPLGTLVRVREVGGPITVTRYNLYTAAQITGRLAPGFSSGDTIKQVDRLTAKTLPLSMRAEWTEVMLLQIRAGNTALYVFALSALSVFLALAALYESWALPMAVILVVPMCLLCSISGVRATGRDVNIFVQIGLVVLVGLACKNAILIVEYAKQMQMEGLSRYEATLHACQQRLRPILMTSLAFIIGVIPLAIASGAGSEMRRSLGIAVFYGMVGVTLFGIFLTPVFYAVIQALSQTPLLKADITRWVGSTVGGGVVGLLIGFLLARLDVIRLSWALLACGPAGVLAALAALGIHRKITPRFLPSRRAPHVKPTANVHSGDEP